MPKTPNNSARPASRSDSNEGSLRATGSPPAWTVAAVLALSIGVVYGRALNVPLIFDDEAAIVNNISITSLWPLVGTAELPGPLNPPPDLPTSARPLVNLSLAMNYYIGGVDPAGYHLANMVLHFLSAWLVWALVRRTLRLPYFARRFDSSAGWLALTVALLWALHPLQTESVIYATQRTELMVAFFYLATLYCSLRYWEALLLPQAEGRNRWRRIAWLTLAVLACLAGMASKEVMVSAPLVVLLFERTFIAGSLKSALRRSWPLYAGLASTWLLLGAVCLGAPHGESAGFNLGVDAYDWWLTQSKVLLMYLKLAVWPSPLLLHYQLPYLTNFAAAWMYVVPVLLLVIVVLILLWRNHPVGFLGAWVFAILAPTFAVPIVTEIAAERRMYLPLVAIVVLFAIGCYRLHHLLQKHRGSARQLFFGFDYTPLTLASLAFLLAFVFGAVSAKRLSAYDDKMNLWREVLRFEPENSLAHNNLGVCLVESGRISDAIGEFQSAVALEPDYYSAFNNLGDALMRAGRFQEAIHAVEHALVLKPDYAKAHHNLGNIYLRAGRLPEAINELELALRLDSKYAEAHDTLGVALAQHHQVPQAIDHLRQAIRLNPNLANARINLGRILATTGDLQEAIVQFERALQLKPDRADVHSNLGEVLGKSGRMNEAIDHFQAAIQIDPKLAEAYSNLALALALSNRSDEAIATSQRGIEIARSTGQQEEVASAEEWLTHYRAELRHAAEAASADGSPKPRVPSQPQ